MSPGSRVIRTAGPGDRDFLAEMLYEAALWDPAAARLPAFEVLELPEIARYLDGWPRPGDRGVVAERDRQSVGAAWYRQFSRSEPGYGFMDEATPELTVAVADGCRGQGIGRALMQALLECGRLDGSPAVILSVAPANPARRLYMSLGFVDRGMSGSSETMVLQLSPVRART